MKIYNKKIFVSGIFMVILGALNLVTSIVRNDLDISAIILIIALFAFGVGALIRSASQRMMREDKLEDLDERNRFIELKSKSKSFRITQSISFVLMILLLVMGKGLLQWRQDWHLRLLYQCLRKFLLICIMNRRIRRQ